MTDRQEIPELTSELIDMSREYLRQETIEHAKRLGKQAGFAIGGAMALSLGAFLLAWALYHGLKMVLPDGEWWVVLARGLTVVGAAGAAGLVIWRMQSDDQQG